MARPDAGPPRVAPEVVAPTADSDPSSSAEELLRLSRLQASEYGFDVDVHGDGDDGPAADDGLTRSQARRDGEAQFKRGEAATIRKVLNEMEVIALKRTSEGFNEVNFTLGVLNCFLISYVIGECPQHLWLLYLIESLYIIPKKFRNMWRAKPLNEALYYLDFCWIMNFLGISCLAVLVACDLLTGFDVEEDARRPLFKSLLGVYCGVLLSANVALPFVSCVFHDVNTMAGLFIHLMPPMVMYTFWWHTDEIVASWPSVFKFTYMDDIRYFGGIDSVAGCATSLYLAWFAFYVAFMLLLGIDLPRKFERDTGRDARPRYDTVFHSTMRMGACVAIGTAFRGRTKAECLRRMEENDFDAVDFSIYMAGHAVASLGGICTVGYSCFGNKWFYKAVLGVSVVLAVVRGARRYTYYSTKMYARAMRKEFAGLLDDEGRAGEYSRLS